MTLWDLRECVRQVKPNCTVPLADQFLNKHIQSVVKKRSWSDLMKTTSISIPAKYSTGLVSISSGNIVSGSATAWPVNDVVATTFGRATVDAPGFCDIYPVSMVGINAGDYLLLDQETTAATEAAVVIYAGPNFFTVKCNFPHAAGKTIQKSSLANLQMTLPNNQIVTVQAVLDAQTIQIDQPFGGGAIALGSYFICLRHARIAATAYRLLDAIDPVAGIQVGTGKTYEWLNAHDAQRTSTGDPLELVSMPPNPGGVMQWEVWPAEDSARVIQVFYVDGWPRLKADTDRSPHFLNEEIFVGFAQGDALCTRVIAREGKQDPYYDPLAAKRYDMQAREYLEEATQMDEGRYLKSLQNWQQHVRGALGNTAYEASHLPGWVSDYE